MGNRISSISLGGMKRLQAMVALNQGWRYRGDTDNNLVKLLYRKPELHLFDNYLENAQYEHLNAWDGKIANQQMDNRTVQPKKILALPSISAELFCSHLTTEEARLNFMHEDEDKQKKIDEFVDFIKIWPHLDEALPSYFANGSTFIRFWANQGKKICLETHNTKWVYPEFDENEELTSVIIRYVYETDEYNDNGTKIWRWHQYKMTQQEDIEYDEPEFDRTQTELPKFQVKEKLKHKLGFVQGVWIKSSLTTNNVDGKSFLDGKAVLDYIDDLNYMASKESDSAFYHLFPVLAMYGIEPSDLKEVWANMASIGKDKIRGINTISTPKPPSDAAMAFLETAGKAFDSASILQDKNLQLLQHALSIVLLDPQTVAGNYQSGRAMEALFRPVVQFVKKKRPLLKYGLCELFEKLEVVSKKYSTVFQLEPGTILETEKKWGNIFTDTVNDIQIRAAYTSQLKLDGIISKKTATQHIAPDFGIKNVEKEITQIESEQETERENSLLDFQKENEIQAKNQPTGKNAPKPQPKPAKKVK